ncbi:MAG: hypothetical protein ICV59_10110 [Thermoleophilia bacterium]|nr:hypothetical protein [Thermoleophilia bacterium]
MRGGSELPIPKRPYRDSAIFYAVLSAIVVGVAAITGGDLVKAGLVAVGFFVVATAWSWWRFRQRLQRESVR